MRGRDHGRGKGRVKGRGSGRVAPAVYEVSMDNIPMNENRLAHNKEIEEEVDIEGVKEIEQEEGVHGAAIGIPLINPVLAQQIMSFLNGLAGPVMLPPTQALTNPLVARKAPRMGEVGGNYASSIPFWVI